MSKIVKKDRVVINEGKYTVPVSYKIKTSNDINNTNINNISIVDEVTVNERFENFEKNEEYGDYLNVGEAEIPTDLSTQRLQNRQIRQESIGVQNEQSPQIPAVPMNNQNYQNNQNSLYYQNQQNSNYREPVRTDKTKELIGEEIIAQSQKTAEIIISHTLESAKRELDAVISQGYKDGYEDGKNDALKIIEPSLLKIQILVDSIKKMQDKMLEEFRSGMFNIIREISNKILHKEIDEKDDYLIELFTDAIQNIKTESFVTVTVSGAQLDFAMRNIDLFRAQVANISDFKIISDKNAEKGTMVLETANAIADASYTVQQEKINYVIEQMKENLSVYDSEEIMPISKANDINSGTEYSLQENSDFDGSNADYSDYTSYNNAVDDIDDSYEETDYTAESREEEYEPVG